MKKTLWKSMKRCFRSSTGRFISLMCLIALGSFALIGLQVAGPDMRETGERYFSRYNLADIAVIGDYGIDAENQRAIGQLSNVVGLEYGYLKDVVIQDTLTSIRVFSSPDTLSLYELVEGRMPEAEDEIALASFLGEAYRIGDAISLTEKADASGDTTLRNHQFRIVGSSIPRSCSPSSTWGNPPLALAN